MQITVREERRELLVGLRGAAAEGIDEQPDGSVSACIGHHLGTSASIYKHNPTSNDMHESVSDAMQEGGNTNTLSIK